MSLRKLRVSILLLRSGMAAASLVTKPESFSAENAQQHIWSFRLLFLKLRKRKAFIVTYALRASPCPGLVA